MRQLGDLADKIEEKTKIGDLAKTAKEAEAEVQKWLAVLARCFELHDAVAVLELDRVLDASPDELDRHRLGLKSARRDRLELISQSTERLLGRMDAAVGMANSKVLFNPTQSPAVVKSSNHVATEVHDFHGAARDRVWSRVVRGEAMEGSGRRALGQGARDRSSEHRLGVKQFGSETRGQAKSVKDKLSDKIAERKLRQGKDGERPNDQVRRDSRRSKPGPT